MKYFRIVDSFAETDRWYLGDPRTRNGLELDPRLFREGRRYRGYSPYPYEPNEEHAAAFSKDFADELPIEIPVDQGTKPVDFTLGSFDMPVVSERIAEHLEACCGAEAQLLGAVVSGFDGRFEIVNAVVVVDAVDEGASEISWRTKVESSGKTVRSYAGIGRLAIRKERAAGKHMFRLRGWLLPLVVSEMVKDVLERLQTSGVAFKELTVT